MTRALDVAVMSEMILATRLRRNKAESFVIVEPFHDTKFFFQGKS